MVDPADGGWVSVDNREWWDVLHDFRDSSGNGMGSDFTELMDGSQARNDSVVSDLNMTGEGSVVGENNFISDLTIMRDVRVGEAKIIGANSSWGILFSSPVDSRVFAKDVAVSYDERGGFAGIFEIL